MERPRGATPETLSLHRETKTPRSEGFIEPRPSFFYSRTDPFTGREVTTPNGNGRRIPLFLCAARDFPGEFSSRNRAKATQIKLWIDPAS